jgi:hypothetical protein
MVHVTADGSLSLNDLGLFIEPVEISDADGKLLGLFVPANLERARQLYAKPSRIDAAEVARRKQANRKGFNTEEVFHHLLTITSDPLKRAYLEKKIELIAERNRCAIP